jgi:integrase
MGKRRLPKYVSAYFDRHGKERFAYRRGEVRRSLPGPYNSPAFKLALEQAKNAEPAPRQSRHVPGSFDELLSLYYRSPKFLAAGERRQAISRGILESFREQFGRDLVANCKARHVEAMLVAKKQKRVEVKRVVGGPEAAKALHKQLKRLFNHALKLEWISVNPAELADSAGGKRGTRHTWTEAEIAQYRRKHQPGTKARLALEIILWTGQRRGDACSFGPAHLKGSRIEWIAAKGEKPMILPLAPQLKAAIEAMPAVGIKTFLVTDWGKPYSKDGFGNRFREWCIEAGLPDECRAHGLRKAITRRAAALEATQQQLKAIGGWEQDAEVTTYTKGVDQARLAEVALARIIAWEQAEQKGDKP